ncbi:hypothetical protein SNEBB_002287 [Seison nebaliae]|nr:hypothetical protein SNEBB_002287 [Seison nebaliae]
MFQNFLKFLVLLISILIFTLSIFILVDVMMHQSSDAEGDRHNTSTNNNVIDALRTKRWYVYLKSKFCPTSLEQSELLNKTIDLSDNFEELNETYWLTRQILLRYCCFIYFVAYLVAFNQNRELIGKNGLLPATRYLSILKERYQVNPDKLEFTTFIQNPTYFWFVPSQHINSLLQFAAVSGLLISSIVVICGTANMFMMIYLWLNYMSIINIGQTWYSFGWESQLLESGFLAIFLCPLYSLWPIPKNVPPSKFVIWAYRWLIFRIMLGAGLIKIRGDECWRDLTCMDYHYETQPVPNPMAYYMHHEPKLFHKFETLVNHIVELPLPIMVMIPYRPVRLAGGIIQIFFQFIIIISGNLSFLNWLTILPALACIDDGLYKYVMPKSWWLKALEAERHINMVKCSSILIFLRIYMLDICLFTLISYLSIPVIFNLLSSNQAMNTSFDPLRIVNTYGAFGTVTRQRFEIIFEGTQNENIYGAEWKEYEFRAKPGKTEKRPPYFTPYHYRLDWLMWFAAFGSPNSHPWLLSLMGKMLLNDKDLKHLIKYNPFEKGKPPKFVRCLYYRYQFSKWNSKEAKEGQWWTREYKGIYIQPRSLSMLKSLMIQFFEWDPSYIDETIESTTIIPSSGEESNLNDNNRLRRRNTNDINDDESDQLIEEEVEENENLRNSEL